ncbi:MAG: helix-turn-helix domain-containing protein [Pseudomonadota bacterium]
MSDTPLALDTARERIVRAVAEKENRLDLSGSMFSDLNELPAEVADIPGLRSLNLSNTAITDLSPIQHVATLEELRLARTQVTNLAPLRNLPGLTVLILSQTPFRALDQIQTLDRIEHLDLEGTGISRVAALHRMERLERLTLANTAVSDITPLNGCTGLRHLWLDGTRARHIYPLELLRRLRLLSLAGTPVDDLTALRSLENLESLDINGTEVEDLSPLMDLPRLSQVWLEATQVTDLRPLLDLPLTAPGAGVWFRGTPATRASVDLAHLAAMEDRESRTRETVAFLRRLPIWPDPLPRDMLGGADRDPDLPRLGQVLRDQRLSRNETFERVRDFTGIPTGDLSLMERMSPAHFENPKGVATDFRQYARHLALDPDWAEEWFWIEAVGEFTPPGTTGDAGRPKPSEQIRAPLEVTLEGDRLTPAARPSGLEPEVAARAQAGWQALRHYLDDLGAASDRLGNAMPRLASALSRLDAALSRDFKELNAVAAGIHGARVVRLADEAPELLMETDAADLAEFAAQITGLLGRFPDWQNYQAEATASPASEKVVDALPELREITDALDGHAEIAAEIPKALTEQIDDVADAPDDHTARTGLARSLQNVLSAITNTALAAADTIRRETGDIAARAWDAAKKTMAAGLSAAALDIVIAKGATLRTLAQTLPNEFGWLETVLRTLGL